MQPLIDICLTVQCGGRSRDVDPDELAGALGAPDIRPALFRLLLGEEGDYRGRERDQNGYENEINKLEEKDERDSISFLSSFGSQEREKGCRGKEETHVVDAVIHNLAELLANAFADKRSRRFYRLVAERVPLGIIRNAMTDAFEPAPREIRRSRAAYFTSCVMPALEAARRKRP